MKQTNLVTDHGFPELKYSRRESKLATYTQTVLTSHESKLVCEQPESLAAPAAVSTSALTGMVLQPRVGVRRRLPRAAKRNVKYS